MFNNINRMLGGNISINKFILIGIIILFILTHSALGFLIYKEYKEHNITKEKNLNSTKLIEELSTENSNLRKELSTITKDNSYLKIYDEELIQ